VTDTADWDHANEAYLAAALGWLRLRLTRCASSAALEPATEPPSGYAPEGPDNLPVPVAAAGQAARGAESWRRRRARAASPAGGPAARVLGFTPDPVSDDQIAQAAAAMTAAAATDPPPALLLLARRFGLSGFERDLLLLCIGIELDPSLAALCAAAHAEPSAGYPTFALALAAFDNPSWQALLPDRPLRHFSMIEIHQPPATPLTTSALRADERIVGYAKGDTYVDDRLAPLLVPLESSGSTAPPGSIAAVVDRIAAELKQAPAAGQLPAVQLLGIDAGTKELVACRVADALGLHLFRLSAQLLPADPGELERLTRLWQRECALIPIALYLDARDDTASYPAGGVARFLGRSGGLVLVDTAAAIPVPGRPALVVEVERPTATEQAGLWRSALGPDASDTPERLAGQFDFGTAAIEQIAAAARAVPGQPLAERAWTLCLADTRKGLDTLAQRIEPKATWDDIVLPGPDLSLLRMIADQVGLRGEVYGAGGFTERTSRGLGINALFAGPSGTGKTMAAEVIANHLRLNLYRIDLSAVVSKYIGETEKNLERLFREAESGGVILLFDEADALFGKRTEIRDSHDRYANIEVSYLLQRMESYRGLSILATNARNSLDTAFVRRLRFVVTFAYPRSAERKRIWQLVFPPATRTEGLDYDRLAQLDFAGGNIFSIALNAAFLAARDGTPVGMRHVLASARVETRKLERPVNEREYNLTDRMVSA
jgi:hypothetical protein